METNSAIQIFQNLNSWSIDGKPHTFEGFKTLYNTTCAFFRKSDGRYTIMAERHGKDLIDHCITHVQGCTSLAMLDISKVVDHGYPIDSPVALILGIAPGEYNFVTVWTPQYSTAPVFEKLGILI
jgi:hypothetical protein